MSEIADFLNAQYDRIEKREHGRYVVSYPLRSRCPVCSRAPEGFESSTGEDVARLEPCGHEIPNAQFVDLYGTSDADPFVLADLKSKRRIVFLAERVPALTARHNPFDNDRDAWAEVLKQLAAPFSGEPGYDERWTV